MGKGSSVPGPALPTGAGDGEVTQTFLGRDPVIRPVPPVPANPRTEVVPLPPPEVARYGPGVPAALSVGQTGLTAERAWRTGRPPGPARRRSPRRRMFSSALTVILLAASGAVLYLRIHHPPFHVTSVAITERTRTGCGVEVTGRITTDGSAGTVSYQWLFRPDRQPPQPLSQSVVAGQHAVYMTVTVDGTGHGTASRTVTLQVLGPDRRTASTGVVVRCR